MQIAKNEISEIGWFGYDEAINLPLAFANLEVIKDLHEEGFI